MTTSASPPELLSEPLLRRLPPASSKDPESGAEGTERRPGGWRCMPFIIGNEACEKLASFGLTANLTVYLVENFKIDQVAAVKIGSVFNGTVNFTPLLGAFVSDAYLGRYRTLAFGSIASLLVLVTLAVVSKTIFESTSSERYLATHRCYPSDLKCRRFDTTWFGVGNRTHICRMANTLSFRHDNVRLPARAPLLRRLLPASSKDPESGAEGTERRPGGWRCMPFIIGNEACEKLASFGLTANLTVYLVENFKIEQVAAVKIVSVFNGTVNFTPLLGAFVSDVYLGRYQTLAFGSIASLLGMLFWTLTSLLPQSGPPGCLQGSLQTVQCMGPSNVHVGLLFFSMGLLAVGAGGVRPCSLPFGVDQFDRTTEQGRRAMNSVFNWYYFTTTAAVLLSMTVVVYIQDRVSWVVGFGISTCLMLLSVIVFFIGRQFYIHVPLEGSIFSGIGQVFVASFRKRNLKFPSVDSVVKPELQLYDPITTSKHTKKLPLCEQFSWLNKAAITCDGDLRADGLPANTWRLCSIQQIEELKCLIQIIPIWASGIICFLATTQQWSFVVLQSWKMNRNVGSNFEIPPASMATIGMLALILFIPIYDRLFVPAARSITKLETGITLLQRQGVGMVISIFSMLVAALVEEKRRESALTNMGVSSMSVLWLTPQLVLMGIAEAFNAIGQIEFYNRQFPEHMLSLAGSLSSLSLAMASYLSGILVVVIQRSTGGNGKASWLDSDINVGRLDYFYYVIAAMGVGNLVFFLPFAHFYRYKAM